MVLDIQDGQKDIDNELNSSYQIDIPGEKKDVEAANSKMNESFLHDIVKNDLDPILCKKGEKLEDFFLILQGNVALCSGDEGLLMKLSAFDYIREGAITNPEFAPDYSAKVIVYAKVLKIKRKDYL